MCNGMCVKCQASIVGKPIQARQQECFGCLECSDDVRLLKLSADPQITSQHNLCFAKSNRCLLLFCACDLTLMPQLLETRA